MQHENKEEILTITEVIEDVTGGFDSPFDKYDCMSAMKIYSEQQVKRAIKELILEYSIGTHSRMFHEKKFLKHVTKEIIEELSTDTHLFKD